MASRPVFPLDGTTGAWASAGIAGTWAGEADGITLTMPEHGAGVDTPIMAAAIGAPIPTVTTVGGDTAAITEIIRAKATTATAVR